MGIRKKNEITTSAYYLVCDLAKIFLTSKFSYLLFCNPTQKTEIRTAKTGGNY
jgi:hypothetical protein